MKTIFSKTDFVLCDIPVPKGYMQSQTHVGVANNDGACYLTTSPYPSYTIPLWLLFLRVALRKLSFGVLCKPYIAEQWENPCLYIGNIHNNVYPYKFDLLQDTPLMSTPEPVYGLPAYNSDPDLFVEDGFIHVLNRAVYRTSLNNASKAYDYVSRIYHIYGNIEHTRFNHQGTELLFETKRNMISPCLTKYHGEYIMTELETYSYNDGNTYDGLYMARSSSIDGFKCEIDWEPIPVESQGYLPWHMSLFENDNHLYAIVACVRKGEKQRCWQMLGEFTEDLKKLHIYQTPLTDYKSYRSSAFVHNSEFVLYNAVVHERIKGSKAVDGRDILMASSSFESLLDSLKKAETYR